jgi:hypothetical protein
MNGYYFRGYCFILITDYLYCTEVYNFHVNFCVPVALLTWSVCVCAPVHACVYVSVC